MWGGQRSVSRSGGAGDCGLYSPSRQSWKKEDIRGTRQWVEGAKGLQSGDVYMEQEREKYDRIVIYPVPDQINIFCQYNQSKRGEKTANSKLADLNNLYYIIFLPLLIYISFDSVISQFTICSMY